MYLVLETLTENLKNILMQRQFFYASLLMSIGVYCFIAMFSHEIRGLVHCYKKQNKC